MRILVPLLMLLAVSCAKKKDDRIPNPNPPAPADMTYNDLGNVTVTLNQMYPVDLDKDGVGDARFRVLASGSGSDGTVDDLYQLNPAPRHRVLLNEENRSPVYNLGDTIRFQNIAGYEWMALNVVEMAKRSVSANTPTRWEGNFTNVNRKYIAFQVSRYNSFYNAWIELTIDTAANRMILHKSGVSNISGRPVVAGR